MKKIGIVLAIALEVTVFSVGVTLTDSHPDGDIGPFMILLALLPLAVVVGGALIYAGLYGRRQYQEEARWLRDHPEEVA